MYGYSSTGYSSYGRGNKSEEMRPLEKDQPLDTVSSIIWDPYHPDPAFIVTSWDGFVRYYVLKPGGIGSSLTVQLGWHMFLQHPVLCCDITQDKVLFAGLATGDIAVIQMQSSNVVRLGFHDAPICGLFWLRQRGCLMSLGYDDIVRLWNVNNPGKHEIEIKLPLKTHTCSVDWPLLLIGSAQSSVSIVSLTSLPHCNFPKHPDDYFKTTLLRFSKFNCSRILYEAKKAILGTMDGRFVTFAFRDGMGRISLTDQVVSKVQKKSDTRGILYGQVDCVDLGYAQYEAFAFVGGTENLESYNLVAKNKADTITSSTSSIGATTAVRISPKQDFLVFATGTDWTKGIYELETLKRPKIALIKLTPGDIKSLTMK